MGIAVVHSTLVAQTSATIKAPSLDALPDPPPSWQDLSLPQSNFITAVSFDETSRKTLAQGSDLWPITWAADDNQYTAFGDGGGFGGSNQKGKVSLGVSRIEGSFQDYTGHNIWGGIDCQSASTFEGKATGIISVDGTLYLWVNSPQTVSHSTLGYSRDSARSWQLADWSWSADKRLYAGSFVNAGRDHGSTPDDFVYSIFMENMHESAQPRPWEYEVPGRVILARVPRSKLLVHSDWQWFSGFNSDNQPIWTDQVSARVPIFEDINGIKIATMCYQPDLKRYLLTYNPRDVDGNFALFESTSPFGPWSKVVYWKKSPFFSPEKPNRRVAIFHFAPKWWSNQGQSFVLVFNVGDDAWNTVEGTFTLNPSANNVRP